MGCFGVGKHVVPVAWPRWLIMWAEGALEFHVHRDRADRDTFVIYEMFRTKNDLEKHLAQPYTQEFIRAIRPYVTGPLRQQFLLMCTPLPRTGES